MKLFAYSWAEFFGDAKSMKFPFISLSFNSVMIPILSVVMETQLQQIFGINSWLWSRSVVDTVSTERAVVAGSELVKPCCN